MISLCTGWGTSQPQSEYLDDNGFGYDHASGDGEEKHTGGERFDDDCVMLLHSYSHGTTVDGSGSGSGCGSGSGYGSGSDHGDGI